MQETSLHASLKKYYSQDKAEQEVPIQGYLIDVVWDDQLIEIQTRNFAAIRNKLNELLPHHPILLVYPIASEKWILRLPADSDKPISRRKSPKRGRIEHVFDELVYIPDLLLHPNLTIEILLIREDEIRRDDGQGSWRRKGVSIIDHQLIEIISQTQLATSDDFQALLPPELVRVQPFSTQELGKILGIPVRLARKMAYCLRAMQIIAITGKRGNALLYEVQAPVYNSGAESNL